MIRDKRIHKDIVPLIRDVAPRAIRINPDLMKSVALIAAETLQYVDPILWEDKTFVPSLCMDKTRAVPFVRFIPPSTHATLMADISNMKHAPAGDGLSVITSIAPALWQNHSFVIRWILVGKGFLFQEIKRLNGIELLQRTCSLLTQDKDFILQALTMVAYVYLGVKDELKVDPDVVAAAVTNNAGMAFDIPTSFMDDKNAVLETLAKMIKPENFWQCQSGSLRKDIDFVRSIPFSCNLAKKVLQEWPELGMDRLVWIQFAKSRVSGKLLHSLLQHFAPPEILSNRDVMILAVEHNENTLDMVAASLWSDRCFLEQCLALPNTVQNIRKRGHFSFERSCQLANNIAPDLWEDRHLVLTWFGAGYPFVENIFPDAWRDDREIFLLIAKHCDQFMTFSQASDALKDDKEFMLRVVTANPRLISCVSERLKKDFDMVIAFLISPDTRSLEKKLLRKYMTDDNYYKTKEKLRAQDVYMGLVDAMIRGPESFLMNLEGPHQRLIEEYLGVPNNEQARLLCKAVRRIEKFQEENIGCYFLHVYD